ncbi:M48 family metalloprotease [Tardiphaga sp. vice352]|uniref:M48 family metalloprotease n=1 Tax=unclassified Tardiphaga TaxID=2631404 RepID=UPI00116577AE|nr:MULTISPECIES: M48 family metalloprotease [unclassified Tardiphaga]QDM18954.1 M48 family metalloprotease [Tardiphaga sp. vice278]QDM23938.1 M48 family metalloprotease [Tardiphaga sp. vice154]QDM29160.1 M48 family metalloprotease [Tardiphaga sp. vice304]QDM34260.1 M48 family metalloprotease [Tardiphaga sp. vice352]
MTGKGRQTSLSRRRWAAPVLLCLSFALSACGDVSRFETASKPFSPGKPAAPPAKPAVVQTPAGEKEHERILASYGGSYDDPRLEALIGKTVDRLVAASERPDLAYKVTILNSGAVNAFALPSGQLYVTRGLIALASDTSELSSVLSHEMAHVLARHASIREEQARQAAVVTRVVTEMGSDPDLSALALAKSKLTMASFSRAQEFEADGIGVGISARAHFDPFGAARFLTAMERNAAMKAGRTPLDPRAQDFLSSHPATPERVQNAQANARQYSTPEGGERDRETYLAAIDNIVYGEDPSEGFVRGRRFLHPKLGFTFQAPESFTLDNTAQAVIGVREGGNQAMRFDVVRVPSEQSLSDYLNSGWMENVDRSSTEELTINGFPAASANAQGDQWQFKVYALRFGSDVYRFIFAAKQKGNESERNARDTVNSFRRLTLAEIQAARPLRIKVVTVQPGDTVESMAHRMTGVDRPVERFRVLNGLDNNASIKARERVKIVVD